MKSTLKSSWTFFYSFFLNSGLKRQIKVKVLQKTRSAATFLPDIFLPSESLLFAEQSEHWDSHRDDLSVSALGNVYLLRNRALKWLVFQSLRLKTRRIFDIFRLNSQRIAWSSTLEVQIKTCISRVKHTERWLWAVRSLLICKERR